MNIVKIVETDLEGVYDNGSIAVSPQVSLISTSSECSAAECDGKCAEKPACRASAFSGANGTCQHYNSSVSQLLVCSSPRTLVMPRTGYTDNIG